MNDIRRVFVLWGEQQAAALHAFLKQNAKAMADQKLPLEVSVSVHRPKASDQQRAAMWLVYQQIAEQAWVAGRQFDAETWHLHCKREFLPEETSRGVQKWRLLPNDERELSMSTEQLNKAEKSEYLSKVMAFAASLGVEVVLQDTQH